MPGNETSESASDPPENPAGLGWNPPSPEHLQELLTGYEILELVGRGGMGAVYKARQLSLDRVVAIKILPPGLWSGQVDYAERFRQEARLMARLMHPGMVAVFDFGQTAEGQLYFVMEFVEGTDVAQMIASKGALPPEQARSIASQVCDTLLHAHKHGIIHHDIKPANVMVTTEGRVKVADFGLAKMPALDVESADASTTMGSPDYIAPECLITGATEDHRVDLYSLGVMLYEMLVGIVPRRNYFPPSNRVKGLNPKYDGIVARAIQHDPDLRYLSAAEFRHDLDLIGNQPQAAAPGPPPSQKPAGQNAAPRGGRPPMPGPRPYVPQAPPKKSVPWGLILGLLIIGGVGSFFFLERSRPPLPEGHAPSKPTAAETQPPAKQGAEAESSSSPPLSIAPASGDETGARQLAAWALDVKGKFTIRVGSEVRELQSLDQLPVADRWQLDTIDCSAPMVPTTTVIPWSLLKTQPQLTGFFLRSRHPLTREDFAQFAATPALTRLHFDNQVCAPDSLSGLPVLSKLRLLRLQNTSLTGDCLPTLRERAPQLEQLTLSSMPMTNDQLQELQRFPKLWELRLMNTHLTADMMAILGEIPALRCLTFFNSTLEGSEMAKLRKLRIFSVNYKADKTLVPSVVHLTELRSMGLLHMNLTDDDLSPLAQLKKLDFLEVSGNPALGARVTEVATQLPILNNLVLADCRGLPDSALERLKACPKLQRLDLRNTNISDAGLLSLKAVRTLTLVQVSGSRVTAAGMEALKRELPLCTIK